MLEVGRLRTANLQTVIHTDETEFVLDYVRQEQAVGFAICLGQHAKPVGLKAIAIDERDVPPGIVHLVQRKGGSCPWRLQNSWTRWSRR